MDRPGQLKRVFSQAFLHIYQPRPVDNHSQPAKRMLSSPLDSAGLCHQNSNQENEVLLSLDCVSAFNKAPETQIRHPPPVDLQYADPTVLNDALLQHELYNNGQRPELNIDTESITPPVIRNQCLEGLPLRETPLPTPLIVRGQSMFGPSPYVRPNLSSSSSDIVDSYSQSVAGSAKNEDTGSPMSDLTTAVGPLTPSALNFGELSLNSQQYSIPPSPRQMSIHNNRVTNTVVPTLSFAKYFPKINPNEVIIVFDTGEEIVKVDKYPLCSASRFFAQILDGPFLDHGLTHRIRLRDDFPYAISIMLRFIETGHYMFDQRAFARFPLLTTLDFHVHAYLAGSKYGITALQDCAIDAYLSIAEHEMNLGFLVRSGDPLPGFQIAVPGFPIIAPADECSSSQTTITPIDRFLNSLVLLWRNTQSRHDAMRKAVLELIKRDLSKLLQVPFFVTLMQEIVGFGDDVVASLGDDGFEVTVYQVATGDRQSHIVRFGV